jgi:unsaturated chondroitin disaccharide hydrolase
MTDLQETLTQSMERIVNGTALAMRAFLHGGPRGHVGLMNTWTGRYAWSATYVPMDVGYLLGRLWLLHRYSGRIEFREWALTLIEPMIPELTGKPLTQRAAGVDIYYGLCWGAEITGSEALRAAAFQATDRLIEGLWNDQAGLFYTTGDGRSTNIDSLLALLSLPWCARRDEHYLDYFLRHAQTILNLGLLRADGSTFQAAHFDEHHRPAELRTHQGWRNDSTWSRGQAWAMNNFTNAWEATGKSEFQEAAVRAGNWWMANVPEEFVPYYDFNDPDRQRKPRDSCAASIATLAQIRLVRALPELAPSYRRLINGTIRELSNNYLTDGGLILHGSWGNATGAWGRPLRFPQEDILPYSNYYFVEALYRCLTEDWELFRLDPSACDLTD